MADKLSEAINPEGEVPEPGSSVGVMEGFSFMKAVAILGAFGLAGIGVAKYAFSTGKSAVTSVESSGIGQTLGEWA